MIYCSVNIIHFFVHTKLFQYYSIQNINCSIQMELFKYGYLVIYSTLNLEINWGDAPRCKRLLWQSIHIDSAQTQQGLAPER